MLKKTHPDARRVLIAVILLWVACPVFGVGTKTLHGHVPDAARRLTPMGRLTATNELRLAIGVPLRDPAGLEKFLAEVYDPTNPNYRRFLTPEELTVRFGPTAADYEAVKQFALASGFKITGTHGNRLLLDVTGSAPDMERAFHFNLHRFKHPTEAREFFAPDAEPTVDTSLPVADIEGLSDFYKPHPKLKKMAAMKAGFKSGSSPDGLGYYFGDDFRKAYVPGTTLTGAGQMVGLLQFDGYYANDVTAYAQAAGGGRTNIVIEKVLLDSFNGTPTSGNVEVSLDIEMAMAMAPGLSKIIVFEAGPNGLQNDVLNSMLASNMVKNLSCSWGWGGGPSATTDNIFQLMAAAGQSFFNASGDTDAFVAGSNNDVDSVSQVNAPSSSPYITHVGGTLLTVSGVNYTSETVWNDRAVNPNGGNWGSSGGVSTYYSIPSWQTNISMVSNGGSTTKRNIPDVALTADYIYSTYDNGSGGRVSGTSCAAPLWAGFMALVNQQAAANGSPPVGFLNPAVYALAKTANYSSCFHDTTTGDNSWSGSSGKFSAVSGYDLCTGWGTPNGTNLINALAPALDNLNILPIGGFFTNGPPGGPFAAITQTFVLTNIGPSTLTWFATSSANWLNLSSATGTLAANASSLVTATLVPAVANNLPLDNNFATVTFSNSTSGVSQIRQFSVSIQLPQLVNNGGFETGDFTGWTLSNNTANTASSTYNAVADSSNTGIVHSGTYGAALGDIKLAKLSQTLATTPGQFYLLSLWLDNSTGGSGQQFIVNWNTNPPATNSVYPWSGSTSFGWTNLLFIVQAATTNTVLQFQEKNPPYFFGLDDVSVQPVLIPQLQNVGKTGTNIQFAWNTMNSLAYQLQYKTNLLQTNWINLGGTIAGINGTYVLTNSPASDPRRFYRLQILP